MFFSALVAVFVTFQGCVNDETRALLDDVATYMSSRPDSALAVLRAIPGASLKSDRDRAYQALLHSQALDKCYIDLQTDSIIAPAVKYYSHHGSPDNQLKTCYYRARIFQNAGDKDSAMEWLVRGERYVPKCHDLSAAGRLYSVKSELYYYAYDYERALKNAITASDFYLDNDDKSRYISAQLDIASNYLNLQDYKKCSEVLDELNKQWEYLNDTNKSVYYSRRISTLLHDGQYSSASKVRDSCLIDIKRKPLVPWLDIADVYLRENNPDAAFECLDNYSCYHQDYMEDNKYCIRLSDIYNAKENYKESLSAYKRFVSLCGLYDIDVLKSSMFSKESQYRSEISSLQKSRNNLLLCLVLATILCTTLLCLLMSRLALRRKCCYVEVLEDKCSQLVDEHKILEDLLKTRTEWDEHSKSIIESRLSLLDSILVGQISSSPSASNEAGRKIDMLISNRDEFILSSASLLGVRNPNLYSYLVSSGLTEWEVGYCSLLMMGIQPKDMEVFFSRRSCYGLNGVIRKKLHLPSNGQKLKAYLNSFDVL